MIIHESTKQFGQEQEKHAADFLQQRGLKLTERNYQCKIGEIDLIMRDKDDTLVFVEVRYRGRRDYGGGLESVTKSKQRKIIRTAKYYLQTNRLHNQSCRFDVIAVTSHPSANIQWVKDAFWERF